MGVKKLKYRASRSMAMSSSSATLLVRAGVSMDAARRYAEMNGMPGYVLAGDELISDALMDIVQKALPEKCPIQMPLRLSARRALRRPIPCSSTLDTS